MTDYIERIWGVTAKGTEINIPRLDAAGGTAACEPRTVNVPIALRKLLQRAGIQPPPAGQHLDVGQVDAQLAAAKFTLEDRMAVKGGLAAEGLMKPGLRGPLIERRALDYSTVGSRFPKDREAM